MTHNRRPIRTARAAVAALALAAVVVAACGTPETVSPTAPIATPTSASAPTLTCDTFQTLRQMDTLLAGRDLEAHYLTIGDKLTLSIWMVDPDIDPAASAATLAANNQLAFDFGLALSWRAISEVPCVRQVFLDINPMIVDRLYRNWYLDVIPMSAFDGLDHPTPAQLVDAVDRGGSGFAFHRRAAPIAEVGPAPCPAAGPMLVLPRWRGRRQGKHTTRVEGRGADSRSDHDQLVRLSPGES